MHGPLCTNTAQIFFSPAKVVVRPFNSGSGAFSANGKQSISRASCLSVTWPRVQDDCILAFCETTVGIGFYCREIEKPDLGYIYGHTTRADLGGTLQRHGQGSLRTLTAGRNAPITTNTFAINSHRRLTLLSGIARPSGLNATLALQPRCTVAMEACAGSDYSGREIARNRTLRDSLDHGAAVSRPAGRVEDPVDFDRPRHVCRPGSSRTIL